MNLTTVDAAVQSGKLLAEVGENLRAYLAATSDPAALASVEELIAGNAWEELNDRFFRTLAFGTGGLRGRTIRPVVTTAEKGGAVGPCPKHPAVGTNTMNSYNLRRATRGLAAYLQRCFPESRPKVCLAHDTRYFSRAFAEETAEILASCGCDALLFESYRSTPELSFAIRHTGSQAGVCLTASHNPPAYNGYKVYFADGGQIIEPHGSGIIAEVNQVAGTPLPPTGETGRISAIGQEMDLAYLDRVLGLWLNPKLLKGLDQIRVVFSALHGTGGVIMEPLLKRLGVSFSMVEHQSNPDGGFPSVASPNPEEKEALAAAIGQAAEENADLVLATDPDADRLGAAVRDAAGNYQLLTGNHIGSLLAWYRAEQFLQQGILTPQNAARGVVIKTLVTTGLQQAIATKRGLSCVNTLTGFKYLGAKLTRYEEQIPADLREGYQFMSEQKTRALRLEHSRLFVFGGEESYGYSGGDFVRDKDAHSAALMLIEVAAHARAQGISLLDQLDAIYLEHGYFAELGRSLTLEGAEGAKQIQALTASFRQEPPTSLGQLKVTDVTDYAGGEHRDEEGELLPKENMLIWELENGFRAAVRPSGTEPKIKFYLFGCQLPEGGGALTSSQLQEAKASVPVRLEAIWNSLQEEAGRRTLSTESK